METSKEMVSSTPEFFRRTISGLPEQYSDLAACFMTVVDDLARGNAERYQEKVEQLAESYFVLILETFRAPTEGMLGTPGVIRMLLHEASSSDGSWAALPHTPQLVAAVCDQFEVRLWGLMENAFSGALALPHTGPCDLLVPVFCMLIKDRIRLIEYDDVSVLKESARQAFATIPPTEVYGCIADFCHSMLEVIRSKPQSTRRITSDLFAFVCEMLRLAPNHAAERLESIRLELCEQKGLAPVPAKTFVLN